MTIIGLSFVQTMHLCVSCKSQWKDNIKVDLKDGRWGSRDWIALTQGRDRWRAFMNAVMNLRVSQNAGNFLTSWEAVGISGRTVFHWVLWICDWRAKILYNTNCLALVMKRVSVLCEVRCWRHATSNFGQSSEISERIYYFSFLVTLAGRSAKRSDQMSVSLHGDRADSIRKIALCLGEPYWKQNFPSRMNYNFLKPLHVDTTLSTACGTTGWPRYRLPELSGFIAQWTCIHRNTTL
jgi:hypothetical protein